MRFEELASGAYEFTVEAVDGDRVTLGYRLGDDLTLAQDGRTVEIRSTVLGESDEFPVVVETGSGSTVEGHWTLGESDTVTFTVDSMPSTLTRGGGPIAGGGAAMAIKPANYWNCVSKTAIGSMAT
jgi:hypothetical protein